MPSSERHGCRQCLAMSEAVVDAVSTRFGIDKSSISLAPAGGLYSWGGAAGESFYIANTGNKGICSKPVDVWVDDFEFRLNVWKVDHKKESVSDFINEIKASKP